ncbi:MAG: tRNA (adenosine(37)-N6)-threonylcarbamoyltransferase complex ATPase subunit type 1 TsaE [Halioglobus sp.]|nr:tRNA (adenosine(37)-N6)-threonylcarbamoyltransferase complex ATPase subunit type 1 TsaE [Halioglobus sp.]
MSQSIVHTLWLADEAASIELGTLLARHLPAGLAGWLFLLQGELGAGKSTVARAMLHALGQQGPVPSPTYTLIEPYELAAGTVYHVDLYRIGGADELEYLGWSDLADGLRLVEWPEKVPSLFATADVCLQLGYADGGRSATLSAASERGAAWLAALPLQP